MEANEEKIVYSYASKLACSLALPMTLSAAIELGLLEHIAAAAPGVALTSQQLAAHIGATNPHAPSILDRILRHLVAHSIFNCSTETLADGGAIHRYTAASVCKYLATNEDGASMATISLMTTDKVMVPSWYHLKDAVLHGGVPFKIAHDGMALFEYQKTDPRFNKVFNEAMRSNSIINMSILLQIYHGFDDVQMLVDVGGGTGGVLGMIIAKHNHIKGINFDLPHVIALAPALPGIEHVAGDVFDFIPSGDAIFMKCFLHMWSDEDCMKILKNCWMALPKNGKVIVVELILYETPETTDVAQHTFNLDVIMLVQTPSGQERTEKEFEKLALRSGFSSFKLRCDYSNIFVMEFIK